MRSFLKLLKGNKTSKCRRNGGFGQERQSLTLLNPSASAPAAFSVFQQLWLPCSDDSQKASSLWSLQTRRTTRFPGRAGVEVPCGLLHRHRNGATPRGPCSPHSSHHSASPAFPGFQQGRACPGPRGPSACFLPHSSRISLIFPTISLPTQLSLLLPPCPLLVTWACLSLSPDDTSLSLSASV